jgi:hypothetical protein
MAQSLNISDKYSLATKADIGGIEIKIVPLETTIAKTENKLILWAFVFWSTQLAAIFAFIKFFIK